MSNTERNTVNTEFPTINRSALVLEPVEGFLEWARSGPEGDSGLAVDELRDDSTAYLIPELDTEPEKWLKRHYAAMFEHELWSWCTDETLWPEDRSYRAFKRFFRVRFCSVVVDMGRGRIARDTE